MSVRVLIQFVISMPTALTLTAAISAPVEVDIQETVYNAMVTFLANLDIFTIEFLIQISMSVPWDLIAVTQMQLVTILMEATPAYVMLDLLEMDSFA